MTETGNKSFEQIFTELVNTVVKQKGGKRALVKEVDEDKLTCTVHPTDKSAPIVAAKITALNKGVYAIPKVDALVSVIPLHLASEQENDWGIIQFSEIDKYVISAEKTISIMANKEGISIKAEEKDINIEAKDNIIMTSEKIKIGSADAGEDLLYADPVIQLLKDIISHIDSHVHVYPIPQTPGTSTNKPKSSSISITDSNLKPEYIKIK